MQGKEFTSFDVAAVMRELKTEDLDSLVSNVYQLKTKTLLLKLHKTGKPTLWLMLEAGRRINLTSYALDKPSRPPAFCMALRKYLRNARLAAIEQHEFERVIVLSFASSGGPLRLVLELFGEGNIILVDHNDKILQAMSYKRMRDRNVISGEFFKFAPSAGKNPIRVKREEFIEGLKSFGEVEIVRGLARFLSIGGIYAEEVLAKAGISKTACSNSLSEDEASGIYTRLQGLLSQVATGALEPSIILDEENHFVDAVPFRLERYGSEPFKIQPCDSFNEALDEFYSKLSALEQASQETKVDELRTEAARLGRIISEQQRVVEIARGEAEQDRRIGDAIYAHFSELQVIVDEFVSGKKNGKQWTDMSSAASDRKQKTVKPWMYFESFDSRELSVRVFVEGLKFDLILNKTLFETAARFYERSKHAKQKMDGAQTALNDSLKKLEAVEAEIGEAEALKLTRPAEVMKELEEHKVKRKEWYEKFRWFVSSDGFLVVAGKDAVTNEVLIKKHTDSRDVVLHADIVGAPFTVIKTEGQEASKQCLLEAAEFAAAFSRGWREGFASVDVYSVKPEQLSKGGPSGESVGHGAFVVRGERNWIRGVPLRIAVGVVVDKETGKATVTGGPVDTVKTKASAYVIIVPGAISGRELFKRIVTGLGENVSKNLREQISSLPVEEIRELIPFSEGVVLKT